VVEGSVLQHQNDESVNSLELRGRIRISGHSFTLFLKFEFWVSDSGQNITGAQSNP
jgi:hypothetical protein